MLYWAFSPFLKRGDGYLLFQTLPNVNLLLFALIMSTCAILFFIGETLIVIKIIDQNNIQKYVIPYYYEWNNYTVCTFLDFLTCVAKKRRQDENIDRLFPYIMEKNYKDYSIIDIREIYLNSK